MEANAIAMSRNTYPELPVKFYNSIAGGLALDVTVMGWQ